MDFKRSRWPWDVHEPKVKHQGFLLKSGKYFGERTAKKRHVALVVDLGGAYLLVGGEGEEEIGSLAQMQHAVGARTCLDLLVGCTIEERGEDRLGFAVKSPGRTYVFTAMGLEQKLRWVTRLKNAAATGMEQSARPDVLENAHRSLEHCGGKDNGHHRATTGPARWQESAGTTDDYVELVESPPPKPCGEDEAQRRRERRWSEEEGEHSGKAGEQEQPARRPPSGGKATGTGSSWSRHSLRETVREYADGMRVSPSASGELDKEMEDIEIEDARGWLQASVSWPSPQPLPSPSSAGATRRPEAVRGFSPAGPGEESAGVASDAARRKHALTVASTSAAPGGRSTGQPLVGGSSMRRGYSGGEHSSSALSFAGVDESLRHRTAAKAAEDQALRARVLADRLMTPGIVQGNSGSSNSDNDVGDSSGRGNRGGAGGRGVGLSGHTQLIPVAFGA